MRDSEGHGHRLPDPRMIAAWQRPTHQPEPRLGQYPGENRNPPQPATGEGGQDARMGDDPVVRPFLLTGGRTRPLHDGLRVETMVVAAPGARYAPLRFELRSIVEWCEQPQSLAEIATKLRAPLGVARVLVGDLLAENLVTLMHASEPAELPVSIIERIRDGVRAL